MPSLRDILRESLESELARARRETEKNPTDGQKEAGNYKKGHVNILGFNISIENPKGSYRRGKDRNGKEWKTLMHNDYGYFTRTLGKDGDAVDVFIGPNLHSDKIYPIDQYVDGKFDETKVMLGFNSAEEAKKAYLSNYEKDWKGFKYITEIDIDEFKKWLYNGARQRKAFALYKSINEAVDDVIYDVYENYTHYEFLQDFLDDKRNGITRRHWNLIPAQQYHNLLKRYMESPQMARIPGNVVNSWFKNIIIPNAVAIEYITDFAGHSRYFPSDDFECAFGEDVKSDYHDASIYLDEIGFYEWCKLPDGSDGWSDYGLGPLFNLIKQYDENADPGDILILINRCLDVVHQRGDLSSAFIEGGKHSCDRISAAE